MRQHCVLLALGLGLTAIIPTSTCFNLTIVHTNDIHAHYEQTSVHGSPCSPKNIAQKKCYGGYPRLVTKVKEYRELKPNNTIVLDAGDQYQGTLWFYYFGGNVTAAFVNFLGYDAMAIGNHEFDRGINGLLPFLTQVTVPVLSANIDASQEPSLQGLFKKSTVVVIGGERVGVIGYTTTETPSISETGKLKFDPIIEAVRQEVTKLTDQGINKIIALGHAGYQLDQKLAKEVEGLDIVIGGHSHTFLYTGSPPSIEKPLGPYPTVVEQDNGAKVPVVQAFCYSKYIGHIELEFDDSGNVVSWQGRPILLDHTTVEDPETLELMKPWAAAVNSSATEKMGETAVFLQGDAHDCRQVECNMGNAFADAIIRSFQALVTPEDGHWTTVAIALVNGGGIRSPIDVGDITTKDILSVFPFRNMIDRIELRGSVLLDVLEHAVSRYPKKESDDLFGGFLQVSGLIVTYDVSKAVGSRVIDVQVRCANCSTPKYQPLDREAPYIIAISTFTANGGDDFTMIRDHRKRLPPLDALDSEIFADYIQKLSPLIDGEEKRIRFVTTATPATNPCQINDASPVEISTLCLPLLLPLVLLGMGFCL